MMSSLKILVLADGGIGGTEKAASIYACELCKRGHKVAFAGSPGPRTPILAESGVKIFPKSADSIEMAALIRNVGPDVIHQHVPGYPIENPIYDALSQFNSPPKFIQTNVFGHLTEPRARKSVDFHLFISKASGSQAFRRSNLPPNCEWLQKSSVVMYPMPVVQTPDPSFRSIFRDSLGIEQDTIVAIRVGQPGTVKWTDWEVKTACAAEDLGTKVKLVLMQPPDEFHTKFRKSIDRGLLHILPATSDFQLLNNLYSAADVMLHASSFGESFGYTIAEGMAAGLPVVCRSTPWGDSAQVELVENGVTGWTCATPREMARRLNDFYQKPDLLTKMGNAGKARIAGLADLQHEIDILEQVMEQLVLGSPAPSIDERNKEFLAFHDDLPHREQTFSEPELPLGERLEWKTYSLYRTLRSHLRKMLKK